MNTQEHVIDLPPRISLPGMVNMFISHPLIVAEMSHDHHGSVHRLCKKIMGSFAHCFAADTDLCPKCELRFRELNENIADKSVPASQIQNGLKRIYQLKDGRRLTIGDIFTRGGYNNVWAGRLTSAKGTHFSADEEYRRDTSSAESVVVKAAINFDATPCLFIDFIITSMLDHRMILKPCLPLLNLPFNGGRQSRTMAVYPRLDADIHSLLSSETFTDHTMFQIFLQLCACLQELQIKYQFMHRDLKPTNVLYKFHRDPYRVTVSGITFENCRIEPYIIDMGMASMTIGDGTRIANDIRSPDTEFRPTQDILFYTANMLVDFHDVLQTQTPDFYAFLQRLYSEDDLLFTELECMEEKMEEETEVSINSTESEIMDESEDGSDFSSSVSSSESCSSENNTVDDKIMKRLYTLSRESQHLKNFAPEQAIAIAKEEYHSLMEDLRTFGVSSRRQKMITSDEDS
jgi:hypothetical protein